MLNYDKQQAASAAVSELNREGLLRATSDEDKQRAAYAIFDMLHEWSAENMPYGANAEISERYINKGLQAVRVKANRMAREQPQELEQKYGVDPITILSVIGALFSIVGWLIRWLRGEV
jgi:soluble lytic murein transglycosylase-like protein